MDEKILSDIWHDFSVLEEELLNINNILPIINDNFDVWSLKLSEILLKAGAIFDSFLRVSIFDSEFDNVNGISNIRNKGKNAINIVDFKTVFNPYYALNTDSIYIKLLQKTVQPLEGWSIQDSPDWWRNGYTNLKHDRYQNIDKASLKHVVYALASIFLVFVKHLPTRNALISFKVVKERDNVGGLSRWVIKEDLKEPTGIIKSSARTATGYVADTTLFSYFYVRSIDQKTEDEYKKYYDPFMQHY